MNARFSLAVHILTLLATAPAERVTSGFLAVSIGANPVVIRRVLGSLRRAGLVTSRSAAGGGWQLAIPPDRITLDRVRQSIAEGETAWMHRNQPHPNCAVGRDVRTVLLDVYRRADEAIDREIASTTIAGILSAVLHPDGEERQTRNLEEVISVVADQIGK